MTPETIEEQTAWEALYEIANCCINWGESDINKEKFFAQAREVFILKFSENEKNSIFSP